MVALSILTTTALAQRSWVLENARIEIGDGRVIERGSIAIRDGVISAVGTTVDASGLEKVDCSGLTVYPGFIEGFTRKGLKLPDAPTLATPPTYREDPPINFWRGNRRGVNSDLNAADMIDPTDFDAAYFQNGVTTVNAASGRGGFGGWSAIFDLDTDASKRVIKAKAFQTLTPGFGGGAGYPGSILGRFALLRQVLFDARNPGEDKMLAELNSAATGNAPILCTANSDREIYRMLNLARETGFPPAILGGKEAWKFGDHLRSVAVVVSLDSTTAPSKEPAAGSETPRELAEERYAQWEEDAKYVAKLNAAGVSFAFSADGNRDDLLKLVRGHISRGLPRDIALKSLTSTAAKIFGVEKEVGTIEVGKRANLAVFTGDFASEASTVKQVFVRGSKQEVVK